MKQPDPSSSPAAEIVIRPLRDEREARVCAEFMAASDPWLTLGQSAAQLLPILTNPAREALVACVGDQIVGVMILDFNGLLRGYIQILGVHPDWRCRGIGTALITWAEQRIFRVSPNVFLCVSSFNVHAQKLYTRLGYQRVGELPGFITPGHSEFLMRKTRGPWLGFKPSA